LGLGEQAREASLTEYYQKNKHTFIKWLFNRIDEYTATRYIRYLDRYLSEAKVSSVKDMQELLLTIESGRNWFIKAVRNLLNFAEEREDFSLEYITKLRKVLKIKPAGVREIFISDEELIEAYDKVKDSLKPFFKLLVYSGIRLSHAVSMVRSFDRVNLVVKDNIARYPINWLSKGKKRGYWAYMPKEFAKELEGLAVYEHYDSYGKGIRFGRVSAVTIRKWHLNKLIELGVPESIADFIQGRASLTVGSTHYLNKTKQADDWYSRIVDNLKVLA
jgi:intergrase/recombinase